MSLSVGRNHWNGTDASRVAIVGKGSTHPCWKGGQSHTGTRGGGYILEHRPEHPRASNGPYVLQHLLVAERALGRPIMPPHEVHHVNGQGTDNRPENLVICEDAAYHKLLHRRQAAWKATGNANARRCILCKEWEFDLTLGTENSRNWRHRRCHAAYMMRTKR